jgi:pyrroloquinoline quinone (PQQ) biosynthesis protein C
MDLIDRIDALIRDRHLLTHPFYTRWREGTLPVEAIQEYTRQYYRLRVLLSRFPVGNPQPYRWCGCPPSILDNLWDEEHGEVNHAEMVRFARAWESSVTTCAAPS